MDIEIFDVEHGGYSSVAADNNRRTAGNLPYYFLTVRDRRMAELAEIQP